MGKNINNAKKKIDFSKLYNFADGFRLLKSVSYAKFDETLEVAMQLGVDPRHSDQVVRGIVSMPFGTGKIVRVAVICKDERIAEAIDAGADIAGSVEIVDDIKAGKINFDVCIASPDMMGVVGGVARILGPKGLMPNPKLGTVTVDIVSAVKSAKSGQVEFRVDKSGIIHAGVGKMSFSEDGLFENVKTFVAAVVKAKPASSKGIYVKSLHISSTMGPALKLQLSDVL